MASNVEDEALPPLFREGSDDEDELPPPLRSFPQFTVLHEDLQIFILTFVAEAPFEQQHGRSPVIHVLPFVSKAFRSMSRSNLIWRMALERLVREEPSLWVNGLLKLAPACERASPFLVKHVHEALHEPGYLPVFRMVVERHLRFTGPVFMMSGAVRLGEPVGLHFFEPRYRRLIRQVMEDFPLAARQGGPITPINNGEYPTFVYAHVAPFAPTSPATLVEVRQCNIHANGSADVLLMPAAFVWMERLWEVPNTGRLHYAQCLRMGRQDTLDLENRSRPTAGFENPLIQMLLQNEEFANLPGQLQGPMRAMLAYLVNDHGDDDDDSEEDDDAGVPAD